MNTHRLILIGLALLNLSSCGTLGGQRWGASAFQDINMAHIQKVALTSLNSPQVYLSAGLAAVLAISNQDKKIQSWAVRRNPLFDNAPNATKLSDILHTLIGVETFATGLLTPSGKGNKQWIYAKAKGMGAEFVAWQTTLGMTLFLKKITKRHRPNNFDRESFPSGHSSSSFALANLSNQNIKAFKLSPPMTVGLQGANTLLASTVAWARVEGNNHFPVDILVGASLGHFISNFVFYMLMGPNYSQSIVSLGPIDDGYKLSYQQTF